MYQSIGRGPNSNSDSEVCPDSVECYIEEKKLFKTKRFYHSLNFYQLIIVLLINTIFFVMELGVGTYLQCLVLLSDSFNMLSDMISQMIGIIVVVLNDKHFNSKKRLTFGFKSGEVIGALINSVFLISVGFFVIIDAIQRFIQISTIDNPKLLLLTSCIGLVVNVLCMILLIDFKSCIHKDNVQDLDEIRVETPTSLSDSIEYTTNDSNSLNNNNQEKENHNKHNMNMKGVFIHVFGDALGSVTSIIVALCIWFIKGNWKYYIDPSLSIVLAIVMIISAIPLLYSCIRIMLHIVPGDINLDDIKKRISLIDNVKEIHNFHIWRINKDIIVAELKVFIGTCDSIKYNQCKLEIKRILNRFHISLQTVEIIFVDEKSTK